MKTKALKANRNNIETYLPVFKGFYGSQWDEPDFDGEAEHFGLPENFPFYDHVKWGEYREKLSKYFCDCVESALSEFIEIVQYQNIHSPKEYNFVNDSVNCIIRPKKTAIKEYIYKNLDAFKKYLKDILTSRDGFISFHSNDFADWKENTKDFTRYDKEFDKQGFNLGFVLEFICHNEQIDESIFDEYISHVYISEFYTEEFYQIVEALEENEFINRDAVTECKKDGNKLLNLVDMIDIIKKFVMENYMRTDIKEFALATFQDIETGFYNTLDEFIYIDKLIDSQIKEIESHTLEIQFS